MNVLLDTNIYDKNTSFQTPEFQALKRYLLLSNKSLLIPSVVEGEVKKHVLAIADAEYRKFQNLKQVQMGLVKNDVPRERINEEILTRFYDYIKPMNKQLGWGDITIEQLLDRSLNEMAPFKSKGRGFRDVLIWYTLLDYLAKNPKQKVAFISENTEDFGRDTLNSTLQNELARLGFEKRVLYYSSLSSFLDMNSKTLEFLTEEIILGVLQPYLEEVNDNINEFPLELDYPDDSYDWEVAETEWLTDVLDNYYIYKEDDDHYYLNVRVSMYYRIVLIREFNPDERDSFASADSISGIADTQHRSIIKEYEIEVNKHTHEIEVIII